MVQIHQPWQPAQMLRWDPTQAPTRLPVRSRGNARFTHLPGVQQEPTPSRVRQTVLTATQAVPILIQIRRPVALRVQMVTRALLVKRRAQYAPVDKQTWTWMLPPPAQTVLLVAIRLRAPQLAARVPVARLTLTATRLRPVSCATLVTTPRKDRHRAHRASQERSIRTPLRRLSARSVQ